MTSAGPLALFSVLVDYGGFQTRLTVTWQPEQHRSFWKQCSGAFAILPRGHVELSSVEALQLWVGLFKVTADPNLVARPTEGSMPCP